MTEPNFRDLATKALYYLDRIPLASSYPLPREIRAALATPPPEPLRPIPVSERLPEAGEWVWHCYTGVRFWEHGRYYSRQELQPDRHWFFIGDGPESQPATHWLPANAIPLPEVTQ